MNFTDYTLGEALSSSNETIRRNAFSILKQLQKERDTQAHKAQPFIYHEGARYIDCRGINTDYCDKCGYSPK